MHIPTAHYPLDPRVPSGHFTYQPDAGYRVWLPFYVDGAPACDRAAMRAAMRVAIARFETELAG